MDFFDHQEAAHRRSVCVLGWFILAVAAVCLVMCGLAFAVFAGFSLLGHWGTGDAIPNPAHYALLPVSVWQPQLYLWTSGLTAAFVNIASWVRMQQLAAGGRSIATLLGARRMDPGSPKREERVLVDVVEEMALAAGMPVPDLYLLPNEWALNAFIAGCDQTDAALFVTEGALVRFDRDQLQALVAHEFSHLLCGDMRLNLKLMGLVHGLFAIYLLGEAMMHSMVGEVDQSTDTQSDLAMSAGAAPASRALTGGLAGVLISVAGFFIALVGWNGAFFGRVIKGWVAREREFHADAAALQFTRHPEGLIALLATANAWPQGGVLRLRNAEEFSHMCFLRVLPDEASWLASTHPAVPERIRRIEEMGGRIVDIRVPRRAPRPEPDAIPMPAPTTAPLPTVAATNLFIHAGLPVGQHLKWSTNWLAGLDAELRSAVHQPAGAEAAVNLLLLRNSGGAGQLLLPELINAAPPTVAQALSRWGPTVARLTDFDAIPLLELCLPALRGIAPADYQRLRQTVQRITQVDQQVDLFEFALQRMLRRHLAPVFEAASAGAGHFNDNRLPRDCSVLLSLLAHAGADAADQARPAFDEGTKQLRDIRHQLDLLPVEACGLEPLEAALDHAALAPPDWQRKILLACAACAASDGTLKPREAELIRAFADAFGCPVPPFAGQ